ncbi:MAG: hypothetical protein K6T90_07615 [Leptolyngbyaceae cyanobacterium HOT.MB2.61]|nr:hypothetical protein [Leptolyngbyaceae cyanobacterium HOT.MB2.61]
MGVLGRPVPNGLIDTPAVIEGVKSGRTTYLGIDVHEQEGRLFFQYLSNIIIQFEQRQPLKNEVVKLTPRFGQ